MDEWILNHDYGKNGSTDRLEAGITSLCRSDPDIERLLGPEILGVIPLLQRYIAEIERFNPFYHLVKVQNQEELVIKHILDSLGPLGILLRFTETLHGGPLATPRVRFADIGSGAGFPGIPLAISFARRETYHFTLIERKGKRAGFLRNTQAVLGLSRVEIEEGEVEKAQVGAFHLITFRALQPLDPRLLTTLFRLLAPGGALFAYKGRGETLDVELRRVETMLGSWERLPLHIPFLEEERHLLVLTPKPPAVEAY